MFDGYLQHVIKIKGLILEQIIIRNILRYILNRYFNIYPNNF